MESTQEGSGSARRLRRSTRLNRPLDTAGASTGRPRKHDTRISIDLQVPQPGRVSSCEKDVTPNASSTFAAASSGLPELRHEQSGSWSLLPDEVVEEILQLCTPVQLGMLETVCKYFRQSELMAEVVKQRLFNIKRAEDLKPVSSGKEKERNLTLLHFVTSQAAAAAQATAVACGAYHSAVLLVPSDTTSSSEGKTSSVHSLYTFGRGFHGQLGTGNFESHSSPQPTSLGFRACWDSPDWEEETMPAVVAGGNHHSASISRRGELFMWGLGSHGELGLGHWRSFEVNIPRQCIADTRIVSIAAGKCHTLAIAENGSLWACGKGTSGQLGLGNTADSSRLARLASLSHVRIVSAAAGTAHSMGLAADGTLFTWGQSQFGQLGHVELQPMIAAALPGNPPVLIIPQAIQSLRPDCLNSHERITAIAAGGNHSMALTVAGGLLGFGQNSFGALGTGDLAHRFKPTKIDVSLHDRSKTSCRRVVQVVCGSQHTIALVSNNGRMQINTTGINTWGQLGIGNKQERNVFTPVLQVPGVVAVQSGDEHCMAVTSGGLLYVWGRGDCGQLGLGNNNSKLRPAVLKNFTVIHPDKTLRRHKRSSPVLRPVQPESKRQCAAGSIHIM
ncbi:MAG: hypothetical protein WDW38_009071 [Sanguina aurantia]